VTTDAPTDPPTTFAGLGLRPALVAVLDGLGYEEPTPIQAQAIPPLLEGRDLLGQAATGTGKTAAFALPLLHHLVDAPGRDGAPYALVLVPTRELAMQVSEAVQTYGRATATRVLPVYGGQPIRRQLDQLRRGVDVVVATPGRAIDHLKRGSLDLSQIAVVVLDEADEMLDMGFAEDLETILSSAPTERQTVLTSATMPRRIAQLAGAHLNDPVRVTVAQDAKFAGADPQIREVVHVVARHHKAAALARVLDVEAPTAALVFCRTRNDVDELTSAMNGRGYRAEALHGGMDQPMRDKVLGRLRDGTIELVVATDVAARGLDIDLLTHVVNHTLPTSPESYVHRIGRVGRAGREGVAVTLVEPREQRALRSVERHVRRTLEVLPLPTIAQLEARRQELVVEEVRAALTGDGLASIRPVLDELLEELDVEDVALAAVAALHAALIGDIQDNVVPDAELSGGGGGGGGKKKGRKDSGGGRAAYEHADGDTAQVWISLGREAGVRPKDLVGAIAGETSLSGKDIGNIQIAGRFSLVEIPSASMSEVVERMRQATVRGKRVHAKPDTR
jgi:ATP-dependent RNA helicase DeaD